ncbi:MAG: NAD(P)H-quinone oxidoreductase subunit F [Cyanobacteria bacterium P01_H01_bin.121]
MAELFFRTSWLIPFYGLLGALLTVPWAFGLIRRTGPRPAAYLNLLMTALAFLHGVFGFSASLGQAPKQLIVPWLDAAGLQISLALEISQVSLGALSLVAGMCLVAQFYALGYLEKEWSLARFFALMGFFESALSGIAISDSLFLTYALLEMLTLSTYLLVGFWYAQPLVVTAARDAFLTKRVGDVILLMGLVVLASYSPGLTFPEIAEWASTATLPPLTASLLGLALLAGPVGKCAQFPLHLWLDEAMEAPSPASILRNSVVVSAGAYVLIKLQPVIALSPIASDVTIAIGIVTALGASLVAIAQIDIKRTLSHSTSAYLGLVFVAVGLQHLDVALLLLLTHAVAKALLFMSAGAIIFTTTNQNITQMGGLWAKMPATTTAFIVGSLGLVGVLPLGMFWTLRRWISGFWAIPAWLVALLVVVNALSAINLTRVFRLAFLGTPNPKTRRTPEVGWVLAVPMVSLTIVTLLMPLMLQRWQLLLTWVTPLSLREGVRVWGLLLVVLTGLVSILLTSVLPLTRQLSRPIQRSTRFVQDLLAYDFYMDRVYRFTIVWLVGSCSKIMAWIDRYIVDGLVNLVGMVTLLSGQGLKYSSSGQLQLYVATILLGVSLLILGMAWVANLFPPDLLPWSLLR